MDSRSGLEIAIIGMAGRFPGARNVDEFWRNLRDGVESISFFTDQELESSGIDPVLLSKPNYVKAKGVLEDAEGREVDFRNTIILLTSNVGTDLIMHATRYGVIDPDEETGVDADGKPLNPVSRRPEPDELNNILRTELQRTFKPAFLGRLTVVPYYPVEDDVLKKIVHLKLQKVADRILANHQAVLQFDEALIEMVTERCTEVDSGARNADAILTNTLLADISSEILSQMAAGKSPKTIRVKVGKNSELSYKFG